jgi:hypothetical protein
VVTDAAEPSFRDDLRVALAAWHRFPWLPAVSVGLAAVFLVPEEPAFLALVTVSLLVTAGWIGTERICYLRAFRGKPIRAGELWRLTRAFLVRYAVLGLLLFVLFIPLGVLAYSRVLSDDPRQVTIVGMYVLWVLVDVALTFVTPALAFSTRRVRRALAIGLRMIRSEWPSSAWYVLVPPLAAQLVVQIVTRTADVGIGVQLLTSTVATLLKLWFKGAAAAFYLRRHEVGDDGAAFIPKETQGSDQIASPTGRQSDASTDGSQ